MTGRQLKDLLDNFGVKYVELASKLNISKQSLNQLFGNNDVKSGMLEKISEVLGIPVSYLYGIEHAPIHHVEGRNNIVGNVNSSVETSQDQALVQRLLDELSETRKQNAELQKQNAELQRALLSRL